MGRTPGGAPGSILQTIRVGKHIGHVMVDYRTDTYLTLWDGNVLGRYDYPEDAIERLEAEAHG